MRKKINIEKSKPDVRGYENKIINLLEDETIEYVPATEDVKKTAVSKSELYEPIPSIPEGARRPWAKNRPRISRR
jgi:hypothetical protein